jgi:predicted protein tyrosine phosphatase
MANEAPLAPAMPGGIALGTFSQASRHHRRYDAVITVEDPSTRPPQRLRIRGANEPGRTAHVILAFEDVDSDEWGIRTATPEQVAKAIEFARTHAAGSLLVHCVHGVGRSAALAYAIHADRMGPGHEAEALAATIALKWDVRPNLVAVGHADRILGRNGSLLSTLLDAEAIRPESQRWRAMRREAVERGAYTYSRW